MRILDYSFESPADNLAFDEVLLENAEAGASGECLRFWESPVPFVVLGLTQPIDDHVDVGACKRDRVSIQRRCTAGGCVIQAPGCLNYAFVLRSDRDNCDTIHGSYDVLLGWIAEALAPLGAEAIRAGTSDLAVGRRKISGNAQKRKRRHFLHHGTLLYAFDPDLCTAYLKEPEDRPAYRGDRSHTSFISNLSASRVTLVERVSMLFHGDMNPGPSQREADQVRSLCETKYNSRAWVYKR